MAVATWTAADGWHDVAIVPYGPFTLDPATAVLHYAQEIFEGLKAYRHADGSVWLFRPDKNAERFAAVGPSAGAAGAASRGLPRAASRRWSPPTRLGARPARAEPLPAAVHVRLRGVSRRPRRAAGHLLLHRQPGRHRTSPAAFKPVTIWISTDYTRAAPGGTGAAKCGGNYAASLVAQQEAAEHGCDQVMFADAPSSAGSRSSAG